MSPCPAIGVLAAMLLLLPGTAAISADSAGKHPDPWAAATPEPLDPATESAVLRLMAQMTMEEKVGQMIQADIASITPAQLRQYKLGSILAGGNAAPGGNVRTPPQAWLDLTDELYRASLDAHSASHAPIPILFGIDAVHGHAKILGATIFPHNVGLGAAHDPGLIGRIGEATAQEVAATGIDWTFAPTVAVVRDVRWGRSYESYSESPELVAAYAASMVTGLQGRRGTPQFMSPGHTLSSVKHFLGDGGTQGGRDQGDTVISEAQLSSVHAAGYLPAIKAGALIVMASYNSWNGEKLHGNHYLLTEILKGRLGFRGFVVGDWNAHEQLPGCTKYRCAAAILAGIDMLMAPDSWRELYENTVAQVRAGEIPQSRIDDAVQRILRVKVTAGMLQRLPPKQRSDAGDFTVLGNAAHRALAREAVRKSLVLLKNERGTLPLDPHATILVAGEAADSIAAQSGGWTIDWQGDHNSNADFPGGTSIYAGIRAAVAAAGGSAVLSKDGRTATPPDAAIVVFGETPYAEFEGDRENLAFSSNDTPELSLLRRLHAAGVPTVAVFLSGRPMWVNPYINAADAFVAAWLPGSEGGGIADVLFRAAGKAHYDFTGRLAFSWPQSAMPVTFDASGGISGAQFAEGFGLDYSHQGTTPTLAEDAQIPLQSMATPGSLFHAGHVTAPWSIFLADGGVQVHLTNQRQASPHGAVVATVHAEGDSVSWAGTRDGVFLISGRAGDLQPDMAQGVALEVRYRIDTPAQHPVKLGLVCSRPRCGSGAGAMRDVTRQFTEAQPGQWRTLAIPLTCFADRTTRLDSVESPFALETSGRFGLTISEVHLTRGAAASKAECPAAPKEPLN